MNGMKTPAFEVAVQTHPARIKSRQDRLSMTFPSRDDAGIFSVSLLAKEDNGVLINVDGVLRRLSAEDFALAMADLVDNQSPVRPPRPEQIESSTALDLPEQVTPVITKTNGVDLHSNRIATAEELYAKRFGEHSPCVVEEEHPWETILGQSIPCVAKTLYLRDKGNQIPYKAQYMVSFEPGTNMVAGTVVK